VELETDRAKELDDELNLLRSCLLTEQTNVSKLEAEMSKRHEEVENLKHKLARKVEKKRALKGEIEKMKHRAERKQAEFDETVHQLNDDLQTQKASAEEAESLREKVSQQNQLQQKSSQQLEESKAEVDRLQKQLKVAEEGKKLVIETPKEIQKALKLEVIQQQPQLEVTPFASPDRQPEPVKETENLKEMMKEERKSRVKLMENSRKLNNEMEQIKKQLEHERNLNSRLVMSKSALEKEMQQFIKACAQLDTSKSTGLSARIKEDMAGQAQKWLSNTSTYQESIDSLIAKMEQAFDDKVEAEKQLSEVQKRMLSECQAREDLERNLEEEVKQRLNLERELLEQSNKLNQQQAEFAMQLQKYLAQYDTLFDEKEQLKIDLGTQVEDLRKELLRVSKEREEMETYFVAKLNNLAQLFMDEPPS